MKSQTMRVRKVLQENGLEFQRHDGWERIQEHVGTHKYLLDLRNNKDSDWNEVVSSWEATVMSPLLKALERSGARQAFPARPTGDLYLEISDHWYFLKQRQPNASPVKAVESFTGRFGRNLLRFPLVRALRSLSVAFSENWDNARRMQRRIDKARTDFYVGVLGPDVF